MVNTAPLISLGRELALARLARQLGQLAGQLEQALAVDVPDDRDDEPVGRVGREADVALGLEHHLVAVERARRSAGTRRAPRRTALSSSATIVTLTSDCSALSCLRNASSSVMSASS